MQFSEEVKATLWSLIDEMALDLGRFTVNPDTDFKRKRNGIFKH